MIERTDMKSQWNRVEDLLPRTGAGVLCYGWRIDPDCKIDGRQKERWMFIASHSAFGLCFNPNDRWDVEAGDISSNVQYEVTHWKYLDEPPVEESEAASGLTVRIKADATELQTTLTGLTDQVKSLKAQVSELNDAFANLGKSAAAARAVGTRA